jgi:hypothetical protein
VDQNDNFRKYYWIHDTLRDNLHDFHCDHQAVAVSREHQCLISEETLVVIPQRYEAMISCDNSPTKVTFLQVGVIIEFVEEKMCVIECKANTMSSSVGDP